MIWRYLLQHKWRQECCTRAPSTSLLHTWISFVFWTISLHSYTFATKKTLNSNVLWVFLQLPSSQAELELFLFVILTEHIIDNRFFNRVERDSYDSKALNDHTLENVTKHTCWICGCGSSKWNKCIGNASHLSSADPTFLCPPPICVSLIIKTLFLSHSCFEYKSFNAMTIKQNNVRKCANKRKKNIFTSQCFLVLYCIIA